MIKTIIKRDLSEESFIPSKLNRWAEWSTQTLGNKVDWTSVVLETVSNLPEKCTSRFLQSQLIKTCLDFDSWSYNRMAGRLYAALIHKDLYDNNMPSVKELHRKLQSLGFMEYLDYTDEEYEQVEKIINHKQDFKYAYYQIHVDLTKYAIADRVARIYYESPQYMYMRMAMALSADQPKERRMTDVEKFYDHFSNNRINAPTPNHINLGTPHRGYASCCLYNVADDVKSIAAGNLIGYTMTYMSAGIGAYLETRSIKDPVRGGAIEHMGKLPYYRNTVTSVKANTQNGRGGACTMYYNIFDPEVQTLINLKNPMSTEDKKIRGMDYSWGDSKLFAKKVAKNEDIFLFNTHTAPDLYKALYSGDQTEFEQLYAKYEADDSFKKTYVNARELFIQADNQWYETGRYYEHHIDTINYHTPFKDTIYSSNLCCEILEPTKPYYDIQDLYKTDHHRGEVATCNLAGIVHANIESDEQLEEVAYYALLMIDKCIHLAHYELPHIGYTSKNRMNAGVGIIGLAHHMAKNKKLYTTEEGKKFIHETAEKHSYYLIKASLKLGKELGNAPWIDKTKWPDGWLPIDTYSKHVDSIADFEYKCDWESLRNEIIENKGIRNSVLIAHMPAETSANASGTTNGLYEIRELTLLKTDNNRVNSWAAPEGERLQKWYKSAWDTPTKDTTDMYAIVQKFTDQGISADFYSRLAGSQTVQSEKMITDYLYRVKMGLKTKYYMNTLTSNSATKKESENDNIDISDQIDSECESCTL